MQMRSRQGILQRPSPGPRVPSKPRHPNLEEEKKEDHLSANDNSAVRSRSLSSTVRFRCSSAPTLSSFVASYATRTWLKLNERHCVSDERS